MDTVIYRGIVNGKFVPDMIVDWEEYCVCKRVDAIDIVTALSNGDGNHWYLYQAEDGTKNIE